MTFNFFNAQIHSLEDLRVSLAEEAANPRDFIKILEDHHDYLEESMSIIMNPKADQGERQTHVSRFFMLVNMHGHAEEETLYMALKENADRLARVEGFGGQDEHDVAYQLRDELEAMDYQTNWSEEVEAKAVRAAGLVKNHIKEEESQMFKIAKSDLSSMELQLLAKEYLNRCMSYLDQEMGSPRRSGSSYVQPSLY